MKIALFVDFDNVYSGLRRISVEAAERFSRNPLIWLRWLMQDENESVQSIERVQTNRRVLVRRCYLNPVMYQKYRRPFHEAGFEIVDCPPMTATGKTSTDIHLVLDTMDALADTTHFDEFIIFSADADFSPVLRRLRRHDRRTVVFAAGAMSESYKASADKVIDIQDFLRNALGLEDEICDESVRPQVESVSLAAPNPAMSTQITQCINRLVFSANAPVPFVTIAAHLQRDIPGIRDCQWDGAGSFGALLKKLKIAEVHFDFQRDEAIDLKRQGRLVSVPRPTILLKTDISTTDRSDTTADIESDNDKAVSVIRQTVANSQEGVLLSTFGQILKRSVSAFESGWPGAKTLAGYLKQLDLLPLKIGVMMDGSTFVVYDPSRHDLPGTPVPDRLVASMLRAAELPEMRGSELMAILREVTPHMGSEKPFEISEVSRRIAEVISNAREPITPRRIAVILQALIFGGLDASKHYQDSQVVLVDAMGVILSAWTRETQIQTNDDARSRLMAWIDT